MENNLKFNSAICTSRSQSERLLALGLKEETADMWYPHFASSYPIPLTEDDKLNTQEDIPAWSLHRLIELIWGDGEHDMSLETHRPFEDCIERIDYMISQSHCFNKEYLE